MTFKQQASKTIGALGVAGAAGLIGALAFAAPASAQTTNIDINPGNVPTTAAQFEQSCDQVPETIGDNEDGWVFVLPGNSGEFISVTATYTDLNGEQRTFDTGADGGIDDGNGTSKAYIITPAGWTLTGATAEVEGATKDQFNLTHTCAGEVPGGGTPTPGGETPTPGSETPTPGSETPTPGDESPTAGTTSPGEVSTTPVAADTLPTTGTPLTVALVSAAALAAAGTALFFVMKRRRAAENW